MSRMSMSHTGRIRHSTEVSVCSAKSSHTGISSLPRQQALKRTAQPPAAGWEVGGALGLSLAKGNKVCLSCLRLVTSLPPPACLCWRQLQHWL